ncbi:MAG: MATE family efflux transporter [Clostridia bacterium]|nr:MATE family efflux transporter [Clostridia bacterium]
MRDLTKGCPAKVIALFALPMMLGSIFQQFYSITDTKIVSMYVGTQALAAVGATAVISSMLISLINGLTQGFSILTGLSFGSKDARALRRYTAGSIIICTVCTALLMSVAEIFLEPFLHILNTPDDIFAEALGYIRIIISGIVFVAAYNLFANLLRSIGDSRNPLLCLIVSIVTNIGLDLFFIRVLHMGVKGAAYATIISQGMSAFMCIFIALRKYPEIFPGKGEWGLTSVEYTNLITTGISMGFMGFLVQIGTVTLQGAINSLGTVYAAAHVAGRRVIDLAIVALFSAGTAMTTFVSQNLGAGRGDRIRQGIRQMLVMMWGVVAVLIAVGYIFGPYMIRWVSSSADPIILNAGIMYIRTMVTCFPVLSSLFILRCSLQGMGRKIAPLVSSGVELTVKIFSAKFLVSALGYRGVALTEPLSWILMTLPLVVVYVRNIKWLDSLNELK